MINKILPLDLSDLLYFSFQYCVLFLNKFVSEMIEACFIHAAKLLIHIFNYLGIQQRVEFFPCHLSPQDRQYFHLDGSD